MTYSIVVRDEATGQMGVACQSQAFAVGGSVPWALPGFGIVATQSMGEPMYGELGLDGLRAGLTAAEALTALRSVDPHPERRQVAMVDWQNNFDVYTGEACIAAAGHQLGDGCAALANMVTSEAVWHAMVSAWEATETPVPQRLVAALRAAEAEGGDFRGRRSASVVVVRARRTGRPWRDRLVELRVDDDDDPLNRLDQLVSRSSRYHTTVEAFDLALAGRTDAALERLDRMPEADAAENPDVALWTAIILWLADRAVDARTLLADLARTAPQFLQAAERFAEVGLVPGGDDFQRLLSEIA